MDVFIWNSVVDVGETRTVVELAAGLAVVYDRYYAIFRPCQMKLYFIANQR